MQSSTTNQVKLNLDWNPMTNVGVSVRGQLGQVDYDEVTLGRTESEKQGYFLSAYWDVSPTVKLNAFGSWEDTKYPSNHRNISSGFERQRHGSERLAVRVLPDQQPELLQPVRPAGVRLVQLELGDEGQDVDGRAWVPTGRRWKGSS
jgi:hypothetical protein